MPHLLKPTKAEIAAMFRNEQRNKEHLAFTLTCQSLLAEAGVPLGIRDFAIRLHHRKAEDMMYLVLSAFDGFKDETLHAIRDAEKQWWAGGFSDLVLEVLHAAVVSGTVTVTGRIVGRPDKQVVLLPEQLSPGTLDIATNSLTVPVAPGVTEVYTNLLVTPLGGKASPPPKKLTPDVAAEILRAVIEKTGSYTDRQEGGFHVLFTNLGKGDVWKDFKAECEKRGFDPGTEKRFLGMVMEVTPETARSDRGAWNGDARTWKVRWGAGGKDKNRHRT